MTIERNVSGSRDIDGRARHAVADRRRDHDFIARCFEMRGGRSRIDLRGKRIQAQGQMGAMFFDHADREERQRSARLRQPLHIRKRYLGKLNHGAPQSFWSDAVLE
jgi:hypothetical protein